MGKTWQERFVESLPYEADPFRWGDSVSQRKRMPPPKRRPPQTTQPGQSLEKLASETEQFLSDYPYFDPSGIGPDPVDFSYPYAMARWINHVRPGGRWDFKQGRKHPQYEKFGNTAYAATGRALGIPQAVLRRAGGLVQMVVHKPGQGYMKE